MVLPHKDLWLLLVDAPETLVSTPFPWHLLLFALPLSDRMQHVLQTSVALVKSERQVLFFLLPKLLKIQTEGHLFLDVSFYCSLPGVLPLPVLCPHKTKLL